jgi:hypothetical protein
MDQECETFEATLVSRSFIWHKGRSADPSCVYLQIVQRAQIKELLRGER